METTADDLLNRIAAELTLLEVEQMHHIATTVHRWWKGCPRCKLHHREVAAWQATDKRVRLALHRRAIGWGG